MKLKNAILFVFVSLFALNVQAATIVDPGGASPIFDSSIDGNEATITDPSATHAAGLTMNVTFTPVAADLISTDGINLLEIGGTSNGTGIYLLGGEVHFLGKMNGAAVNIPTFDDLAFDSGNNMVSVKSTFGQLAAGTTYTVAASYDPITGNTLDLAVREQGVSTHVDSYALTGVGTKTNWSGDDTVTNLVGNSSVGGGNNVAGNPFNETDVRNADFTGTKDQGLLYNTTARMMGQVALGWTAEGISDGALATWNTSINNIGGSFSWTGSGTKASGTSNFANVNDWISSPAYNFSPPAGDSWQDGISDAETKQDATWEIILRPGDFTGNHVIFDTGGNGDGTAIVLEGSVLDFRFQDNNSATERIIVSIDLSTLGAASDFYHIVGTADIAGQNPGTGELYVNGVLVDGPDTSSGTINDWDGGDPSALGTGGSRNIPGNNTYASTAFTGDIALFNYYSDQILSAELVLENYNALIPEPATLSLLGVGGFALLTRRKRK